MIDEAEYHKRVAEWLRNSFSDIEHEPRLDTGKRPDFFVHTPFESYVIEVEDTFADMYNGLGQVRYYGAESGYTPIVIFPAETVEEPEFSILTSDPTLPLIVTV